MGLRDRLLTPTGKDATPYHKAVLTRATALKKMTAFIRELAERSGTKPARKTKAKTKAKAVVGHEKIKAPVEPLAETLSEAFAEAPAEAPTEVAATDDGAGALIEAKAYVMLGVLTEGRGFRAEQVPAVSAWAKLTRLLVQEAGK